MYGTTVEKKQFLLDQIQTKELKVFQICRNNVGLCRVDCSQVVLQSAENDIHYCETIIL